jgi:folate-binding Fe-S cluster repair protein YgfZ
MRTLKINLESFEVRANRKFVDVESADKQWKVQFGWRTKGYAQILYLIENKDNAALKQLCNYLFFTRLVIEDVNFLKLYQRILGEHIENIKAVNVTEEEQQQIIKEEKALHDGNNAQ